MNASVEFVDYQQSLVVLKFEDNDFVIVRTQACGAMLKADDIAGDPSMDGVKWFLNITHSKLIDIKVLGRCATLNAAVQRWTGTGHAAVRPRAMRRSL